MWVSGLAGNHLALCPPHTLHLPSTPPPPPPPPPPCQKGRKKKKFIYFFSYSHDTWYWLLTEKSCVFHKTRKLTLRSMLALWKNIMILYMNEAWWRKIIVSVFKSGMRGRWNIYQREEFSMLFKDLWEIHVESTTIVWII